MGRYSRYTRFRRARGGGVTQAPPLGSLVVTNNAGAFQALAGDDAFESDIADVITVQNGGPGSLAGTRFAIAYSGALADWLSFTYTIGGGITIARPTIDPSALAAGTGTATVTITDANASNSGITATIDLTVTAPAPVLRLLPSQLSVTLPDETVAGNPVSATLSNAGAGTLATPTIGTITGTGAAYIAAVDVTDHGNDTYTIAVTPTALGGTVGNYIANVPIISSGATGSPITLTVLVAVTATAAEQLVVDRTLDDIRYTVGSGNTPNTQVVGVRYASGNPGASPFLANVVYSGDFADWLTISLVSGTLTSVPDMSGIASEGNATCTITLGDAGAGATVEYEIVLRTTGAAVVPTLTLAPSTISRPVTEGSSPSATSFTVGNATGQLADLGAVGVALVPGVSWANVTYASGSGSLTFTTSGLAAGTYTTAVQVTATLAGNSPRTIPVTVTVSAVSNAVYPPGPQVAALPNGWTYDQNVGHPVGSCFNDGGYSGAANGAMPSFSGSVYRVPQDLTIASALSQLASGAIGDGDVVEIAAGTSLSNIQWPARSGWTEGTSGFVQIRSSGYASLPAYQSSAGPNKFTATNRVNNTASLASMFTITNTTNNRSALLLQLQASGYWFTGMNLENAAATMSYAIHTGSHSGTGLSTGQLSNVPSHIVFDRCAVTLPNGTPTGRIVSGGSRYTVWRQCYLPSIYTNNTEQQAFSFLNGCARWDVIGCRFGGWGEHILFGGGTPAIQDFNPTDFMFLWNFAYNNVRAQGGISDDNKNAFEVKTGGRIGFWFNRLDGLGYKADQKYAFLVKASDQAEIDPVTKQPTQINLFPAHSYDISYWGNELVRNVKKGFCAINDQVADAPSPAAIGTERIEIAWNVHAFDFTVPSTVAPGNSDKQAITTSRGQGDGVPSPWIYQNTYDSFHSMVAPGAVSGTSGWSNVRYFNNFGISNPVFAMVLATTGGTNNTNALNACYGAGNWDFRRNAVLAGARNFDSTLLGGNYQNILAHSSSAAQVFANPAAGDYTIINAPSSHYYDGAPLAGGFVTTIGYSKAYLDEMLAGVEDNT